MHGSFKVRSILFDWTLVSRFGARLLADGQPARSALFPHFEDDPRGGGENADRAPEMDIQFAFPFRAGAGFEWPEGPFLCLNSWFEDVFMV